MSLDHYVTLFTTLLSFAGWLLVVHQLRDATAQRRVESQLQLTTLNRELLTLGFSHPELFQVLHGRKADPLVERHYLQLWFNQFALIHSFHQRRLFAPELHASLERDLRDFLTQDNLRRHWQQHRQYYPGPFQAYVDGLLTGKADVPPERPPRKRRLRGR